MALIATRHRQDWSIFCAFSSATQLTKVMGYVLRFIENSKNGKQGRVIGSLTLQELDKAITRLTRIIQEDAFAPEMRALRKSQPISRSSKLISLSPFINDNGVLRVGGRLLQSNLPYAIKHPMLLPLKHPLTKMLIAREHQRLLHAGAQATLASLRQRFWPLAGRTMVRQVIRSCIKCFRASSTARATIMGDLPTVRVTAARPFIHWN